MTAAQDDDADDETATLTHTVTSANDSVYNAVSADSVVVNITDDDDDAPATVEVSFEQDAYTVAEGSSVAVKVKLDQDPERTVIIPITKTNQDGATVGDYSGVPTSVTFNSGDTEKSITFQAADDAADDDGESVKLTFGTLPTGVTAGTTDETVVSITDDDSPSVGVSFEQGSYTVAEGSSVTVKVKLDQDPERTVIIPITKTEEDGATGDDYSGVPASVTFNSGDTEVDVTFQATDDTADDDGESVKLGFGSTLPTDVSVGTTNEAVVSITDDDVPSVEVSFEQGSYTVAEGSSVTVKVTLDEDPERTVTIPITKTEEDGATGGDYSGVPVSVTFNSGDTEKSITFQATDDAVDDDGESVKLGFGSTLPTGVTAGTTNEAVVSITDDDVPSVEVSFEQDAYTVAEGSSVAVKVKLDEDPERTVTIPITKTEEDGATGGDYSGVPASVTFNSGDTEKSITFQAADDAVDDDGESVKLTFGTLPTGVSAGTTDEAVVSITDDDVPSVEVSFEQGSYTVAEGSSVTVKVTLDEDPERTVTIPITKTEEDRATGGDYSGVPASVTFNSGDTEKSITFQATDDAVDDDGESVKLTFGTLPTGVSAGTTDEAVVSITDDDETPQMQSSIQVSYGVASYALTEGSTVDISVILSDAPEKEVAVPITATELSGTSSSDYSGVPASVTFNAGDTEMAFTFTAILDQDDENTEELTLGFGTLPSGLSTETPAQALVSIFDSATVSFGESTYQAYEGGPDATVTIILNAPAVSDFTVPITALEMNGATPDDWTGVPPEVTFVPGQRSKSFTMMAYDDEVEDSGESVEVGFGNLPAGLATAEPSTATVQLMNTELDDGGADPQVQCDNLATKVIILDGIGDIANSGDSDYWIVDLDPYRDYLIEAIGADDGRDVLGEDTHAGDLTLIDPDVLAIWNSDRTVRRSGFSHVVEDLGRGRNSMGGMSSPVSGQIQIEIGSKNGGTGTYQIKVRLNNICQIRNGEPLYEWFGGPEGYDELDTPPDTTTEDRVQVSATQQPRRGFLGDIWDPDRDEDWWGIQLTQGFDYKIEMWAETREPEEHRGTRPKILGIYDSSGTLIDDTASTGRGDRVSVDFRPTATGLHYIAAGSRGSDRTGVYVLSASERRIPGGSNSRSDEEQSKKDGGAGKDQPENSPAEGAPVIGGTPKVGETLTVDTSGVSDPDGMEDAEFAYQWTASVDDTDSSLAGATDATYTLTEDDQGKSLTVRVSFTDDRGNQEEVSSAATAPVEQEDVPEVEVSFEQATYTVPEGSSVTVRVTLGADPERKVTIAIIATNQGGASGDDYSGVPAGVEFAPGGLRSHSPSPQPGMIRMTVASRSSWTSVAFCLMESQPAAPPRAWSPSRTTTCRPWRSASSRPLTPSPKAAQ